MWDIKCRERIALQQDIQAALHPEHTREFRMALGRDAWGIDSPEYAAYAGNIIQEKTVTLSE